MRILTVSNCPLVATQGSGYVTTGYCAGLCARGHVVDAFGPEHYEPWRWLGGRAKSYRLALGMAGLVLRQLRRNAYDVVELYGGEGWLAALLLGWLSRRRLLVVAHSNGIEPHAGEQMRRQASLGLGTDSLSKWYHFDQTPLFRLAFTRAHGIVTVSEFDLRYALENGYQGSSRLVAIDNPLPGDYLGLPPGPERARLIGFCGSWIPRKGIEVMRRDAGRILAERPECRLRLIGVGPDFKVEEHFDAAVRERVEAIPHVGDRRRLRSLYQEMAILAVPSLYESFGLVTAEAMACGCAVVATPTGFAAGLVDGEEAILIARPQSPLLYDALCRMLDDEPRRRAIAAAGQRRVQRLVWSDAVERLERTYLDWLGQRRAADAGQ